jgi:uncharacterized membrane protein
MRAGRSAFAAAAMLWAASLPAATYEAAASQAGWLARRFAFAIYAVGSMVCHQQVARSFESWGVQWPVCARCTGLYFGAAVAAAAFLMTSSPRRGAPVIVRHHRQRTLKMRLALVVAGLPTVMTLLYEWTSGTTPSNWTRAVAGAALGVGIAFVLLSTSMDRVN